MFKRLFNCYLDEYIDFSKLEPPPPPENSDITFGSDEESEPVYNGENIRLMIMQSQDSGI